MNNPTLETFLNLRRTFPAPRDLVFKVWTEAEALEGWFKPQNQQTKVVELDLRVGGGYSFETRTRAGEVGSISGRYLEIVRPEKLVFTWISHFTQEHETLVTLEFLERGKATEVVLTHERFTSEEMVTRHLFGWNWMLDQLTTFL
jgi:uncharacterized protein YndB with AHSA1/START domain